MNISVRTLRQAELALVEVLVVSLLSACTLAAKQPSRSLSGINSLVVNELYERADEIGSALGVKLSEQSSTSQGKRFVAVGPQQSPVREVFIFDQPRPDGLALSVQFAPEACWTIAELEQAFSTKATRQIHMVHVLDGVPNAYGHLRATPGDIFLPVTTLRGRRAGVSAWIPEDGSQCTTRLSVSTPK